MLTAAVIGTGFIGPVPIEGLRRAGVHITSPNRHHFGHASASLAAGKHVLCEKPLAMNSSESSKLVALAKKSDRYAGVNYNIRYYPLCIESSARIADGSLGKLFPVSGSYSQDWLFHPTDFNWRVLTSEGGELSAVGSGRFQGLVSVEQRIA